MNRMSNSPCMILDIQSVQSPAHGTRGIARYTQCFAEALLGSGRRTAMLLNPELPVPAHLRPALAESGRLYFNTKTRMDRLVAETGGRAVYHILSPFENSTNCEGMLPSVVRKHQLPVVATLYDLIPLSHLDFYLSDPAERNRYASRLHMLEQANLLLSISQSARQDAIDHLSIDPKRVVSIGTGVDPFFDSAPIEGGGRVLRLILDTSRASEGYIMTLLGDDPRKNLHGLLKAYGSLSTEFRARHPLVVAGGYGEASRERHLRNSGIPPGEYSKVIFLHHLSDEELKSLYQHALLFVFPSLYEGFGLPAAEAMACGCPTIVSNTSSLPEVLDWPPGTFNPNDSSAIAETIRKTCENSGYREELRRHGLTASRKHRWEAVVEKAMKAIDDLPPPGKRKIPSRLRLALVGPLPPVQSGIATYNRSMVRELERLCDVDVFVPGEDSFDPAPPFQRARRFPLDSLNRTFPPAAYDLVVYTLGNSRHHLPSLRRFRHLPGVVWLHDVKIYGLYYFLIREDRPEVHPDNAMMEIISKEYPDWPVFPGNRKAGDSLLNWLGKSGPSMNREIVRNAPALILHSQHAEKLVLRENSGQEIRTFRLPLATTLRPESVSDPARPPQWLLNPGGIGDQKAPLEVLDLFVELRGRYPNLKLVYLGGIPEVFRRLLTERAKERGLPNDAVHITGYCSDTEYGEWLAKADLAILWRKFDNGENSASALDCLAAGIPLVTNVASLSEYPPGVLRHLPPDAGPAIFEAQLDQLLRSPDTRRAMQSKALAHVETLGFTNVATRLLELCEAIRDAAQEKIPVPLRKS